MKKILFFVLIIALFSCKKDSEPEISGDWDMTFIITGTSGTDTQTGLMSIIQNGSELTGTLNWGGMERPLLSQSNIGDIVTIYCENLLFAGAVNEANNMMEGDLYSFDYFDGLYSKSGTWQATRK